MLIWHDGSSRNDECAPVDLFIQVTSHSVSSFHFFCQGQLNREACGTSALFAGGLY